MKVADTIAEMRRGVHARRRPLGLVPTMGFLHDGHLSLVRQARADNQTVAVSIFVNPTQFGPHEDFAAYPRDRERDLALLEAAGVDLVFAPTPQEMYPPGHDTYVEVGSIAQPLEGAARPGHFRGVATVVSKLFNSVCPDRAYFGQKDAQQLAVIRKMVADLNQRVEIVGLPIVREADGLAMSSRNTYLTAAERCAALALSRGLAAAARLYEKGERDASRLRGAVCAVLDAEPLARTEYVSVADAETLQEIQGDVRAPALLSLAVRLGATRLIDNMVLGQAQVTTLPDEVVARARERARLTETRLESSAIIVDRDADRR